MLVKFKGFTEADYSYFTAGKQGIVSLFIFFVMPRLKIHPSLYCAISIALQGKLDYRNKIEIWLFRPPQYRVFQKDRYGQI